MKNSPILSKSMDFSIRIVNLYKYLTDERREFVMSRRLLNSGTNVGAKAHEANNGETGSDFLSLMNA